MQPIEGEVEDVARKGIKIYNIIFKMQIACSQPFKLPVPVICAMHGAVIGGAIDLCTLIFI